MISDNVIEIFNKDQRIASHMLNNLVGMQSTQKEHLSPSHFHYIDCSTETLVNKAKEVGLSCELLITHILTYGSGHFYQKIRTCLGILRLEKSYGVERLEKSCDRALKINAYTFKSVESILKNNLDQQKILPKKEKILLPTGT